ncbi:MAG: hypothetical protein KJO01_07040 [Gammaproteobacteria bacterium]|nr:hypothetical protein [Gammaproteobacteria bacterium]MBT8110849.1 hypothetical protein [Gammaproteobacteria bacterium]NNL45548.1 hypothetical protein [Woeseiaceae bacterium]
MKMSITTSVGMFFLLSSLAHAGVVMDMVTKNASGREDDRSTIYAQSKMVRMDEVRGNEIESSMIFLGNEFLYVDHRKKSYMVMDEAMLNEVSAQISDAMKQMEAELARMPPEQRAMVEQMMKGQMGGMMGQKDTPPPAPSVKAVGSGKWLSKTCRKYAVFEGAEKTQELCAAELDDVDGGDEVMAAFRSMAAYITKMTESMPMDVNDGMNPGELMDQIDGFPVLTTDYENGVAVRETSVDSVIEKNLEPGLFAAPDGYRRENPFQQP